MTTTSKRLHRLVNSAIVLPFLLAALLLGLGSHASAASHTTINATYHAVSDVTDLPPGH